MKSELENLRQKGREERVAARKAEKDWKSYRKVKMKADKEWKALSRKKRRARRKEKVERDEEWKSRRRAEQERKVKRKKELENDRYVRPHLKGKEANIRQQLVETRGKKKQKRNQKSVGAIMMSTLVAILIVMDVKGRKILGLPVFESGKHVTSKEVVEALDHILPSELKFLVSDNGAQFITEEMQGLMELRHGTHIRITPSHPKANAITERTVQTIKRMLRRYSWAVPSELRKIIEKVLIDEFHDRPHQGLPNHFSPNAYEAFCKGELVLVDA